MATANAAVAARIEKEVSAKKQLKIFLSRYFYFCMSLVMAGLVVWGFSHTVETSLFHAHPPRPLLLWIHGAAFILQNFAIYVWHANPAWWQATTHAMLAW